MRPIVFWALLALATFVVPFTVRDSGYALMFLPIAGVAAGLAWRRRVARLPWAAPAAAAMAALLVLPILGAIGAAHADRSRPDRPDARGLSDEQALATLDRQAKASQNLLRLYLIAAPEALGADVSTEAEGSRSGRPSFPTTPARCSGAATCRQPTSPRSSPSRPPTT
jgi:hypothetical protein